MNGGSTTTTEGGSTVDAPEPAGGTATDGATRPEHSRKWYRTGWGIAIAAVDTVLLAAVVVGTTGLLADVLGFVGLEPDTLQVTVRAHVYVFGVLGALGFVFMALVRDFDREFLDLARVNLRIPAAAPLAAGMFLLTDQFLGSLDSPELVAGVALLTGLFVDLAYKRIDALAHRLLPEKDRDGEAGVRHAGHPADADGQAAGSPEDGQAASDS